MKFLLVLATVLFIGSSTAKADTTEWHHVDYPKECITGIGHPPTGGIQFWGRGQAYTFAVVFCNNGIFFKEINW